MMSHAPKNSIINSGFEDFGATLVERFSSMVETFPSHIAFVGESVSVSYAELDILANKLANLLSDSVAPGNEPVGLIMDQGLDFVVALLAVLKSGKSYVPLDCEAPELRLNSIIRNSECCAIITDELNYQLSKAATIPHIPVLRVSDAEQEPTAFAPATISPDDTAYVIFTSGSTGEPKGVMQNHKSVLHSTFLFSAYFRIHCGDRQSLLYTPGVFGGQRDTLNALLNGATLVHYPLRSKGLLGLADWIDRERITIYCSVASVFRRMADGLQPARVFDTVRLVKCGGEATYWEDVDRFRRHFTGDCELFCGFSMTETNLVTSCFVTPEMPRNGPRVPLGMPVQDKEVLVLNESGVPHKPGNLGEIAIRSRYVSPGYLGRDDLTQQSFSRDSSAPDVLTFRTGDMGLKNADGSIEFRGRKDSQVKIRGFRVDPLEVEIELGKIPPISECAVVAQECIAGDLHVVAFVSFKSGEQLSFAEIGKIMSTRLPKHMCPQHYVVVDRLPRTLNGKPDRQSLPRLSSVQRDGTQEFVAARGELEVQLLEIWEKWLGIFGVGTRDDFFSIGGDSLKAAQLLIDVNARFGVAFAAQDIMDSAATVAGMARQIKVRNPDWRATLRIAPDQDNATQDIDFAEFEKQVARTNMPQLYYIDTRTGLRRAKPGIVLDGIAINSLGFRGPEIPESKPTGVVRIAFLGSSGTFDPCVESNEHTWPHQTCLGLNQRNPEVKFDYVNAGLNGYNIRKVHKMYTEFVAPLQPDVAVICINDINVATAYRARELGIYSGVHFRHSRLAMVSNLVRKIEKNLVVGYRILRAFSERGKLTVDPAEVLAKSTAELTALVSEIMAGGTTVLLVENGRCLRPYQTRLQQCRAALSQVFYLPYLSIPGYFRMQEEHLKCLTAVSKSTGCELKDFSDVVPGDARHFADSSHFTYQGSRVFAEAVAAALEGLW